MSDALNIMTPFGDVASLGQGFAQRADGEHLWLPMAQPLEPGTGVEFVVFLADGTPAFAGAGQCLQVSDLGEQAEPQVRFETALGALQFDERSQPVYDYIVAMNAALAQAQSEAAQGADVVEVVEADADIELAQAGDEPDFDMGEEGDGDFASVEAGEAADAFAGDDGADVGGLEIDAAGEDQAPAPTVSMIPKGMLQRPAIAMHWKPAPAEPPQASPASGLFQYNGSGLPVPAEPPRPDLDPSLWVQPAGRPAPASQTLSEAPDGAQGASAGDEEAEFDMDAAASEGSDGEFAEDYASDASNEDSDASDDDGAEAEESSDGPRSGEYEASEDGEYTDDTADSDDAGDAQEAGGEGDEAGEQSGEQSGEQPAEVELAQDADDGPSDVVAADEDEDGEDVAMEAGEDVAMEEGEVV